MTDQSPVQANDEGISDVVDNTTGGDADQGGQIHDLSMSTPNTTTSHSPRSITRDCQSHQDLDIETQMSFEPHLHGQYVPIQYESEPVWEPGPYSLQLPLPDPAHYYDLYHHPYFPFILPAVHTYADPWNQPFMFPQPLGPLKADRYHILGARLHDWNWVNERPNKRFTKYMLWYIEVDEYLIRLICPSDLNCQPCEWDELQGGCPMLRLCEMKHKYPHPHLGMLPPCLTNFRHNCKYLHDIEPTCRSISKQLQIPAEQRFRTWQRCSRVANGDLCAWGHDMENARFEAAQNYWEHRNGARQHGSRGVIMVDISGRRRTYLAIPPGL